jgi:hypothetical protein
MLQSSCQTDADSEARNQEDTEVTGVFAVEKSWQWPGKRKGVFNETFES